MEEKTLVILLGNARGGEQTWESMYKNLLEPYNADLALLFGKTEDKSSSLYDRAKHIWEMPEYEDWGDYYKKYCKTDTWEKITKKYPNDGVMGGVKNIHGSGSIIFAFRHFLKNNKKNILETYDRIILTRADHFYVAKHPVLDNNFIWIVEGEDYEGITDRHHIFHSKYIDEMLGVLEFFDDPKTFEKLPNFVNPEAILRLMFIENNVFDKIRRFSRVQFIVGLNNEQTRWTKAVIPLPGNKNMYIKYVGEYNQAIRNLGGNYIPENYFYKTPREIFIPRDEMIVISELVDFAIQNGYKKLHKRDDFIHKIHFRRHPYWIYFGDGSINKQCSDVIHDNVKKVFATNVIYHENEKIIPHPLGIQGKMILFDEPINRTENEINIHDICYDKTIMINLKKRSKKDKNLAYLNFGMHSNPIRKKVYDMYHDKNWVTSTEYKVDSHEDFKNNIRNIYDHKFVFSPQGYGPDCHRTWECIYMGTIPIVEINPLYKTFPELPILFIRSWEDELQPEFLEKQYREIINKKYDYRFCTMSYWKDMFIKNK